MNPLSFTRCRHALQSKSFCTSRNITIGQLSRNRTVQSVRFSTSSNAKIVMKKLIEATRYSPDSKSLINGKVFEKEEVLDILDRSIEEFRKLQNVVSLSRPVRADGTLGPLTVCGDTHGQFLDLAHIFEDDVGGFPSADNPFIFNGDMVDRGMFAFEIVMSLLMIKLEDPAAVHILRGNHETSDMYESYGFRKEILFKYDRQVFAKFQKLFQALPVAAVLGEKVFVVHGGIGPRVTKLQVADINAEDRFQHSFGSGSTIEELLWADPSSKGFSEPTDDEKDLLDPSDAEFKKYFRQNYARGSGVVFGPAATKLFLRRNNLELLVRSHEVRMNGYDVVHDGKCITVFSAPNYCNDGINNKGALVRFQDANGGMEPSFITFSARHYPMLK